MADMTPKTLAADAQARAWKLLAKMQGLVCMVCKSPPAFQRRHRFYSTGLCLACETDIRERGQWPG